VQCQCAKIILGPAIHDFRFKSSLLRCTPDNGAMPDATFIQRPGTSD
jgi:hypothetical protein